MNRLDFVEPLTREDNDAEAQLGTFDLASGSPRTHSGQPMKRYPEAEHFGRQPLTSAWDDEAPAPKFTWRKPVGPPLPPRPVNTDRKWILEHLDELNKQYPRGFIAVLHEKVIGHHSDGVALRNAMAEQNLDGEPIIWGLGVARARPDD